MGRCYKHRPAAKIIPVYADFQRRRNIAITDPVSRIMNIIRIRGFARMNVIRLPMLVINQVNTSVASLRMLVKDPAEVSRAGSRE